MKQLKNLIKKLKNHNMSRYDILFLIISLIYFILLFGAVVFNTNFIYENML